jgi:MFS-type transporter involved in bile tolerance (Atg22 family)
MAAAHCWGGQGRVSEVHLGWIILSKLDSWHTWAVGSQIKSWYIRTVIFTIYFVLQVRIHGVKHAQRDMSKLLICSPSCSRGWGWRMNLRLTWAILWDSPHLKKKASAEWHYYYI